MRDFLSSAQYAIASRLLGAVEVVLAELGRVYPRRKLKI